MRTTVTLDPDVARLVRDAMRDRGITFKQAVNDGLRAGIGPRRDSAPADVPTFSMGEPLVDVTKALRLAGDLEDDERARRLAVGR